MEFDSFVLDVPGPVGKKVFLLVKFFSSEIYAIFKKTVGRG